MNTKAMAYTGLPVMAILCGCARGGPPSNVQPRLAASPSAVTSGSFAPIRPSGPVRPPVPSPVELDESTDGGYAFKPYRDPKTGKTWRLFISGAMGNGRDLWLAEKVNGHWVKPIFTGVVATGAWLDAEGSLRVREKARAEPQYRQILIRCLARLPELTRDSDGDGLTDLEEETRTFTDPHNPDTNHNGIPDGRDPWPNVVSRPLSEAEWLLATAFKRGFLEDNDSGLAFFVGLDGCLPFTLPGRKGPTIWISKTQVKGLTPESFHFRRVYFEELNPDAKGAEKCIAWCSPFNTASVKLHDSNITFLIDFEKREGAWVISNFQEEIADPPKWVDPRSP